MAKGAARLKGTTDEPEFRRLIVGLTPELDQALRKLAALEDRPLAWLIRKALTEYLQRGDAIKLRKPCQHDRYEEHPTYDQDGDFGPVEALHPCPGGEFLADGPLVP